MTQSIHKIIIAAGASVATLCFAANAVAETTYEDMLANLATGTGQYASLAKNFSSLSGVESASNVQSWLSDDAGQYLRWTTVNGSTSVSVSPTLTYSEGTYSLSFTNRTNYSGSVVGFSYSLSDYTSTTGFEFTYTFASDTATSITGMIGIVYQTSEGWQISYNEFTTGTDESAYVSVSNLTLSSSTVYVVLATSTGGGNTTKGTISAYAVVSSVPEPSAFGLLAGIGALVMVASRRRRNRKVA